MRKRGKGVKKLILFSNNEKFFSNNNLGNYKITRKFKSTMSADVYYPVKPA